MNTPSTGVDSTASDTGAPGTTFTVSASTPDWPERRHRAEGPNVVVVLVDDMGFSDLGCYGSEIPTPNIDALADAGVRHRNFHTAPICSPTRASLLTGMNPHRAGFGRVASFDPGFAGYGMDFPEGVRTIADRMREGGYSTFAVGKWHLCREMEQTAAGSRHGWPLQRGFDRFYGFLDGFTNFHHPHQLVADNHHLSIDEYPDDYYLTDDLTDQAVGMMREHRSADNDKPFFLYLAHGAVHAPLQAPEADIDPFRGRYDAGWDVLRTDRFSRQKDLGLLPDDTILAEGQDDPVNDVPLWDSLTPGEQRLAARTMEVYAAMVATVDRSIGTLRSALEEMGEWDDTIVMIMSDNGASSDYGRRGTTRFMLGHGTPVPHDAAVEEANIDLVGGPRVFPHYANGWALAGNTPFRLYKRNTHAGGHSVPFIAHWPSGRLPSGEVRTRYAHVVDLLPTILEMVGIGVEETGAADGPEIDGLSFAPTLWDGSLPGARAEQIYESHGNRGMYVDGWEIVSEHTAMEPFDTANWELYDLDRDPTETDDRAARDPDRVAALERRWEQLAATGDVFPVEDGSGVFFHQRPSEHRPHDSATFWPGLPTVERIRARDLVWNRSFRFDVAVTASEPDQGVLVAHGDQSTGYVLWVEDGRVLFATNAGGVMTTIDAGPLAVGGPGAIPLVERDLVVTVDVRCPVLDRWDVAILVDGEHRGGRDDVWMRTGLMTPLHGIDIGLDRASPVSWELHERRGVFRWTGGLSRVTYHPGEFAADAPQTRVEEFRQKGLAIPGSTRPVPHHAEM